VIAHRPYRPALRSRRAPDAAASTASRPASVTIAIRPFVGWDGWDMQLIWVRREGGNFLNEDWTTQITLIAKEIFPFSSFRPGRRADPESGLSCAKRRISERQFSRQQTKIAPPAPARESAQVRDSPVRAPRFPATTARRIACLSLRST
jgi:hypothetical protein